MDVVYDSRHKSLCFYLTCVKDGNVSNQIVLSVFCLLRWFRFFFKPPWTIVCRTCGFVCPHVPSSSRPLLFEWTSFTGSLSFRLSPHLRLYTLSLSFPLSQGLSLVTHITGVSFCGSFPFFFTRPIHLLCLSDSVNGSGPTTIEPNPFTVIPIVTPTFFFHLPKLSLWIIRV